MKNRLRKLILDFLNKIIDEFAVIFVVNIG